MSDAWYLYIIECRTKELYVGVCKNVLERVKLHNTGRAARYTKFRRPVNLIYQELCESYSHARKREKQVKKYSRQKKFALVKQDLSAL